ncbi:MAG: hypothetical protein COT35_03220 [Nitrospirae bacterium CG08_land_8_20_14_0_20_52_24]|nr:MAG: hypothetical protein COT35_03220 [Nitrospirae bacterium CG08_land_8_20_14_0_20_52_24]
MNRAVSFGSGDLNPHWFHKPAFLMYLLFFEYGVFYLLGRVTGFFPNVESFSIYYVQDPWPFILIGRMTITVFGIATVYLTYKIGEKYWSKRSAILSAIFLTLCYGHVFAGQDVKADVPTTFFTILALYYLLKVLDNDFRTRDYILTGLFAGLGTATKYYSIALLPCILIISLYESIKHKRAGGLVKYIYSLISFWAIFFAASPYNFIDPLGRRESFGSIIALWNKLSPWKVNLFPPLTGELTAQFLAENREGHYIIRSIVNYLNVLFEAQGSGIIIGAVFICAVFVLLWKADIKNILLLSYPIIFSAISIVVNPSYTEVRHQLIIYPFLSIAAGVFAGDLAKRFKRPYLVDMIFIVLLIFPLFSIVRNNIYVSKTDTRTLARNWIEANIPAGTKLLLAEGAAVLRMNRGNIQEFYEKAKRRQGEDGQFTKHLVRYYDLKMQSAEGITYDIKEIRFPWWRGKEIVSGETIADTEYDRDMANPLKTVGVNDYGYYVGQGYRYAVTSSDHYESFVDGDNHRLKGFPSFRKFYHDLFTKGKLVKEFNADELNLPGPTVKVIQLK